MSTLQICKENQIEVLDIVIGFLREKDYHNYADILECYKFSIDEENDVVKLPTLCQSSLDFVGCLDLLMSKEECLSLRSLILAPIKTLYINLHNFISSNK
jgi:hypothetical protein